MILLNFSHPLTENQIDQVQALTGNTVTRVIPLAVQFDNDQPFLPQISSLMDQIPLSSEEIQTEPLVVNLPALSSIAALVLAELHGRMGFFPPILRLRPVAGSLPPAYEVAEVINLQNLRDASRRKRNE